MLIITRKTYNNYLSDKERKDLKKYRSTYAYMKTHCKDPKDYDKKRAKKYLSKPLNYASHDLRTKGFPHERKNIDPNIIECNMLIIELRKLIRSNNGYNKKG